MHREEGQVVQLDHLDDSRLVVLVLSQPAKRKCCHLFQLHIIEPEHVYEGWHSTPLHNLRFVVRFCRCKLAQQEGSFSLALMAIGRQEANHRLQGSLIQYLTLDVL